MIGYFYFFIANNHYIFHFYVPPVYLYFTPFVYKVFQSSNKVLLTNRRPQKLTMPIYQDVTWKINKSLNYSRHMLYNEVVYC